MGLNQFQAGAGGILFSSSNEINVADVQLAQAYMQTMGTEISSTCTASLMMKDLKDKEGEEYRKAGLWTGLTQIGSGLASWGVSAYGDRQATQDETEERSTQQAAAELSEVEDSPPANNPLIKSSEETDRGTAQVSAILGPDNAPDASSATVAATNRQEAGDKDVNNANQNNANANNRAQQAAMERGAQTRARYSNVFAPMARDIIQGMGNIGAGFCNQYKTQYEGLEAAANGGMQAANSIYGMASGLFSAALQAEQSNGNTFSTIIQVATARV